MVERQRKTKNSTKMKNMENWCNWYIDSYLWFIFFWQKKRMIFCLFCLGKWGKDIDFECRGFQTILWFSINNFHAVRFVFFFNLPPWMAPPHVRYCDTMHGKFGNYYIELKSLMTKLIDCDKNGLLSHFPCKQL